MRFSRLPIFFSLTLLLVSLLCTGVRAQTAPPNDSIDYATVVTALPFTEDVAVADASLATDDSPLLACEDGIHSFWYSFTPSNTGLYRIASGVDGATEVLPANDLTLGLFTINEDMTVDDPLECEQNDRIDGGGEVFFATLDEGVTYYVRVALVEAATGDEVITTTIEYVEEITFTAAVNPFWDNPDNWSPAQVPTASDKVVIPEDAANFCSIRSVGGVAFAAEARMLEIENGYLSLSSGNSLTVAEGETGIRLEGEDGGLAVSGELTVRDMINDGINLTDGIIFFENEDDVLIENIGDDGLQVNNGSVLVRKNLTIRNVADNGVVVDGGQVNLRADHSVVIEDITDHGITVFNDGELYAQGELTIQRVGKDGITTPGGRLEILSTGVVNIETAGDFGIGDADFGNNGYLRIEGSVDDGIDTDFECTNNGELIIVNVGDNGIDIQDDSTFINNGYLEVDNAAGNSIVSGYLINTAESELVFNSSIRTETTYANGSRMSVGPGVASASFLTDPVLDSVTLVADIEGNLFTGGNDDFWTVGDFDLADSKLELSGSYVPEIGETFDIVSASQGSILGTFEGLPEGSTLTFNGVEMQITYLGGNVNAQKVTLTAISEPTYTWTGAEDSSWGNTNNWDFGVVPGSADSVYIPVTTNDPVVNTGFTTVGSILVDGAELTVASGTILNVKDQTTGLRITNDGQVNVNGPLTISGQQSKGIDIVSGFIIISESTRLTVDNSFVELDLGLIEIIGELFITNAVEDGLSVFEESAVSILETGTLQIEDAAGDGLVFSSQTGFQQLGTTNITGCGGNGISVAADLELTVRETGDLTISGCAGNGINLADETTAVVNNGLLTLTDNGGNAVSGGTLTNNPTGTLRAEGTITASMVFEDGSRLEPGASPGCLTFTQLVDLGASTVVIEIEETGPCSEHDQLIFEAGVTVSEATLELAGSYAPIAGVESFAIAREQSFGGFFDGFAGLPDGTNVVFNGIVLQVSYEVNMTTFENETVLKAVQNADEATWSGAVSSDWFTSGNWENDVLPFANSSVTIPEGVPNQPVIGSGEETIADLLIEEGNTFTLADAAKLTVDGGVLGLSSSGDSITIAGELIVDNIDNGFLGINLSGGGLYVTPTGSVRLDSLGISDFLATTISVAGSLEVSNSPFEGISLADDASTFMVEAGGSVAINNSTTTGLRVDGTVQIDGSLTINGGQDFAVLQSSQEDFVIGTTGVVTITNNVGPGLTRTGITGRLVNDGTLVLAGNNQSTTTDFYTIENGAQSVLRADGTLRGEVVFAAGSNLFPGTSPGCLTFGSQPADLSGAVINLEIEGTTACDDYDQLTLGAGGDLTDAVLSLSGSYVPEVGEVFSIVKNEGLSAPSGTFAGLPEGSKVAFNGVLLEITYPQSAAEEVLLTAVSVVLPLDLLSFTGEARDKINVLSWTTANEEGFSHFEVERSAEGLGPWFGLDTSDEPLHVVPGTHPMSQTYTFTDQSPLPTAYYRLKMIDLDGTFSYSEVVFLENFSAGAAGAMKVYPNPSNGRFTVDLSGVSRSADQPGKLGLVDMHGRTVWSADATTHQAFSVEIPQPAPGIYLLSLTTTDGPILARRIIIH